MKDSTYTIRRSARFFFSGTLLSRITGMFRDISMAYAFGTSPAVAAFMVAFRFAHLLRRLFGEGALQSSFIPEFEALRHQDEERARIFFCDLTRILTVFLLITIFASCTALTVLIQGGILEASRQILTLTALMFPSLLFICLFGLNASLLQCNKKYFVSSAAPAAFNIIWIIAIFATAHLPPEEAMARLSYGVIIACLGQWLLTVPSSWEYLKSISFSSFFLALRPLSQDLLRLIKPLSLGILGVAASQINNAIDSVFSRVAEQEGPAFLWYSIRIQQLPLALYGVAIAGAVLPPLSRAIKAQQWDQYDIFLQDALYRTWLFMVPLTAALFLFGNQSVNFLYGHGDFGAESVIQTTYCLWAYGIGLIPSAIVLVLAPACYANNNYSTPAFASLFSLVLNILLNSLFIFIFGWGAISVAFSTSLCAWFNLFILGYYVFRTRNQPFYPFFQKCLPISASTLIALWGFYKIKSFFYHENFVPTFVSDSLIVQFFTLASQGLIFISLLFLSYFILIPSSLLQKFTLSQRNL